MSRGGGAAGRIADLYYLHDGLPRQAPGSDASTIRALSELAGRLPPNPRVLDIGCGPGRSAMVLAEQLGARVTAIDIHQPYLDQLRARAGERGLGDRIHCRNLSMATMDFPPGAFDLIWAEGSAYFLGIRESLASWLPLLKQGRGFAAFTELCWLNGDAASRPAELRDYWAVAYPAMATSAEHVSTAVSLNYRVLTSFVLPPDDWWDEYLTPLEARIRQLEPESRRRRALAGFIDDSRRAISLLRRYPDCVGYVFHIVSGGSRLSGD